MIQQVGKILFPDLMHVAKKMFRTNPNLAKTIIHGVHVYLSFTLFYLLWNPIFEQTKSPRRKGFLTDSSPLLSRSSTAGTYNSTNNFLFMIYSMCICLPHNILPVIWIGGLFFRSSDIPIYLKERYKTHILLSFASDVARPAHVLLPHNNFCQISTNGFMRPLKFLRSLIVFLALRFLCRHDFCVP